MSFGVLFIGKSCAIPGNMFAQTDPNHWVLDVTSALLPVKYSDVKRISLFLTNPNALPPGAALCLYVAVGSGGEDWQYRGYVSNDHPSDVFPLLWPEPQDGSILPASSAGFPAGWAKLGVSLEPLAAAAARDNPKAQAQEEYARHIGLDLFQYLQSFPGVPSDLRNALDKWFQRVSRKLKLDPEWLMRQEAVF